MYEYENKIILEKLFNISLNFYIENFLVFYFYIRYINSNLLTNSKNIFSNDNNIYFNYFCLHIATFPSSIMLNISSIIL